MKLYHVSDHAELILQSGFQDDASFYRGGKLHRGVWLTDESPEPGPDVAMERTIVVVIPDELAARYEWLEEGSSHRRFLIPARVINRYLGREPGDPSPM